MRSSDKVFFLLQALVAAWIQARGEPQPYMVVQNDDTGKPVRNLYKEIGNNAHIEVHLNPLSHAVGLRVTKTFISPSQNMMPRLMLLNEFGCPGGKPVLISPFVSHGKVTKTPQYKIFIIEKYNSMYFNLTIQYCYGPSDTFCGGSNCIPGVSKRSEDAEFRSSYSYSYVLGVGGDA